MLAIILSITTFFSTLGGGITALKNRDRLHRILGYTAGVLLGVVAFDILPEIFEELRSHNVSAVVPMVALVTAFLIFHILEKTILIHHAHDTEYEDHKHPQIGILSATALAGHSFLDGVGIGLGFQVGSGVGIAVAIAVIAHDFADGLNTVSLMLNSHNSRRRSFTFLLVDAIAPVLGAASTLLFHLPPIGLIVYLGFFAGFLLYIGASDILPEAHSKHSSYGTMALTVLGALFMFIVTRFA
ncbi:MAG TPA: ZIP family metal transporter [Candidatus Saccharimonadales bacterium]|jgi:ZIP family zinc transporter|nr:ZIP family metal transporter [Candidatus Saccharimonadales bacterium]